MEKKPTAPHTGSTTAPYGPARWLLYLTGGLILAGLILAHDSRNNPFVDRSPHENALRYDVNAPITSLDPLKVQGSGSTYVFPLLYSYLFIPDESGELIPDLATRWDFDADNLRWTIYLRTNARFHNRRLVMAQDVKYSIERHIAMKKPELGAVIDRVTTLYTAVLILHLKRDDSTLLDRLWDMEIVPHDSDRGTDGNRSPVGSGPFRFTHRQGRQMVTLTANTDYYGGPPAVEKIVFFHQPDREKAWTRLLAGATDIAQEISPGNYRIIREFADRFHVNTYAIPYYTILLYDTKDPLFKDPMLRRALSLAIDRQYMVDHLLNGFGRVAAGPMGVDSAYRHPWVQPLPFDPVRALSLLERLGWRSDAAGRLHKEGRPFEFNLLVFAESQVEKKVARFIQLCLNRLGIQVHLQARNHGFMLASYFQKTGFQAVLTELNGAYLDPGIILKTWSPGAHGKAWAGGFDHAAVNRLRDAAQSAIDPDDHKAAMHALDEKIASLQPGTFLYQKTALDAMSRRFDLPHPFRLTQAGTHHLRHASLNPRFRP